MPETKIEGASASDLTAAITSYSVEDETTDAASEIKETRWINEDWTKQFGYYKNIPELKVAIDAKATWTVGKGFIADPQTTMLLQTIKGWGRDTFNSILENCIRTYHIGGDAFCEIIRDETGILMNVKPLDPQIMVTIVDGKGRIKRYEQESKVKGQPPVKFKPERILHFTRNRVADEVHGQSVIDAVEDMILMRNEAMSDWKRVLHRNVEPLWIFHLDTDDTSKVAEFKAKYDAAKGKGENMYIPKDAVVPEVVSTASNATLNPLPWIENLNKYFFQAVGVPNIIVGASADFTEASAKIAYLAFQQTIEEEQLFIEEEIMSQLNLVIELEFPASLENEVLSDKAKDGEGEQAAQPNDTTAGETEPPQNES